jgi:hypothetical protein
MDQQKVIEHIVRERAHQNQKWGSVEDNPHGISVWLDLIAEEWVEARDAAVRQDHMQARREIVQIAALCVACLEQHGAVGRAG